MKEYVPIYFEWLEVTQDLSPEEKGNLIDAVVAYASGQEYEQFLTGGCRIAFRFLKGQVDRNNAISDVRSNARKNKPEQTETNADKPEQNESNFPKEKDKEKEKEKEKDKKRVREKEPLTRFTPPTVEEVADYCKQRGNGVDPERFVAFYSSKGWMVGNQRMKDWRAAVITWEKRDGQKPPDQKVIIGQQFGQRDYSGEDSMDDVLDRLAGVGS